MKNYQNNDYLLVNNNKLILKIENNSKLAQSFLKKLYIFLKKKRLNIDQIIGSEVFENSFFKQGSLLSVLKVDSY